MKIIDSLSKKSCESILKLFLGHYVEVSKYNLDIWKLQKTKKYYILKIHSGSKCYSYFLYKLPRLYDKEAVKYFTKTTENAHPNIHFPKFVIKNKQDEHESEETFLGFEDNDLQNFVVAENMDKCHMDLVVKTLAEYHAKYGVKPTAEQSHFKEYDRPVSSKIINKLYKELDVHIKEETFSDKVQKLLSSFEKLETNGSSVQSLGNFEENTLFMYSKENRPIECKIFCISNRHVPPLFEFLTLLFATEEQMRMKCFQVFLNEYFTILKANSNITPLRKEYELEIKSMLPFVKLEKALYSSLSLLPEEHFTGTAEIIVQNAVDYFKSNTYYRNSLTQFIEAISEHIRNPAFSKEDCYEVARSKLKSTNFQLINYQQNRLAVSNGILGEYFHLELDVECGNEQKHFQFFLKALPTNNQTSVEITETGGSQKEDFFYKTLLEEYKNCGLESLLDFAPKCYFSRINDVIVLEDITKLGFANAKHRTFFNIEHLLLTIKQLAKLHACSILYEEIRSKDIGESFRINEHFGREYFKEIIFQLEVDNDMKNIQVCSCNSITEHILKLYPDVPKKLSMAEFKQKATYALHCFTERLKTSVKYRNVVSHGDLWSTNILFKPDDTNGKLVECRLVDFQLIRYCPPSHDLLTMIYLTTNRQTRKEHMEHLLNFYHSELTDVLQTFGCDINDIYPYETFKECCAYSKVQAVCQGLIYTQIVNCPIEKRHEFYADEERFDYNMKVDRKEFIHEMIQDEFYENNLRELVEDLYEICENDDF